MTRIDTSLFYPENNPHNLNNQIESMWNKSSIHMLGLFIIAFGLPVSKPLISIGIIITGIGWFLNKGYLKIKALKKDPIFLIWLSIFCLHIIGLIYSTDQNEAWHDIKVKLPILLIPLLLTNNEFNVKSKRILFIVFITGVSIEILKTIFVYFSASPEKIVNIHNITGSLSHIRLGGMINVCILILSLYFIPQASKKTRLFIIFVIVALFSYLVFLQSLSSLITLVFVVAALLFVSAIRARSIWRPIGISLLALTIVAIGFLMINEYKKFNHTEATDLNNLPQHTASGNPYSHDISDGKKENGHFVGLYTNWNEMESQWKKRSIIPFDEKDKSGNQIRYTLQRYLASKGLTKDSTGINALTELDIKNIENGIPNYLIPKRNGLVNRIHSTFFEIQQYMNGGDPSGHTLSQRFEYWKTAIYLIRKNIWTGVGTGDMPISFAAAYEDLNSPLQKEYRLRSHNQFLAFGVAFGITGILLFTLLWITIFFQQLKSKGNLLELGFFIIAFLSMLTEDTLETQVGVTFTLFFFELMRKKNE